jgi:hypothetical protein
MIVQPTYFVLEVFISNQNNLHSLYVYYETTLNDKRLRLLFASVP